jgi:hypothetical protein
MNVVDMIIEDMDRMIDTLSTKSILNILETFTDNIKIWNFLLLIDEDIINSGLTDC